MQPADGSAQFIDMTSLVPDISKVAVSSCSLVSIGVSPQHAASSTRITLRDEVSSRMGFWTDRDGACWPPAIEVMSLLVYCQALERTHD
jgi:hypothetical protein